MLIRLFGAIDRSVEFALFLIFLAFTVVGGLQVFNRFVLGLPLSWSEEFQKFGHIWMVMLALPVAYRRGAHLGMDMLLRLLPATAQRFVAVMTELLWLLLAAAIGRYTLVIMDVARNQESPGLGLPMHWVYAGMVVGSVYLALVAGRRFAAHFGWHEPPPHDLAPSETAPSTVGD
jgi:TRAP-type transport system small permease protein